MTWSNSAFIAALGSSAVGGSLLQARAARLLTADQNNQVVTLRALRRVSRMFLLFYVGAAVAILAALGVFVLSVNFYVLALAAASGVIWAHVTYFRKLRALGLPPAYLVAVRHSRMVVYCGLLVMLAIILYDDFGS